MWQTAHAQRARTITPSLHIIEVSHISNSKKEHNASCFIMSAAYYVAQERGKYTTFIGIINNLEKVLCQNTYGYVVINNYFCTHKFEKQLTI